VACYTLCSTDVGLCTLFTQGEPSKNIITELLKICADYEGGSVVKSSESSVRSSRFACQIWFRIEKMLCLIGRLQADTLADDARGSTVSF